MAAKNRPVTVTKTADLVLALGILMTLVGGAKYWLARGAKADVTVQPGSVTERQLAIANALKTGQTHYSFTTNFIPGVGTITDPSAYKTSLLNQLQGLQPAPQN